MRLSWCVINLAMDEYNIIIFLQLIQAVRRLYQPPGAHLSLHQVVELNRRLLKGYDHFKDKPMVQKLIGDVLKYNRLLQSLGVRDHQVFFRLRISSCSDPNLSIRSLG